MENCKVEDEFPKKLIFVLKKITTSQCKTMDQTYLEKLLSNINFEFENGFENYLHLPELSSWLSETLMLWKNKQPSICVAGFICQFLGVLSKHEQGFNVLQKANLIDEFLDLLEHDLLSNTSLVIEYIRLLSEILNHNSGCNWEKNSKYWKFVIDVCFSNSNFYVDRDGIAYIQKFVNKVKYDDNKVEEVFQEVLLPISKNKEKVIEDKNFYSKINVSLRILKTILKVFISVENSNIYFRLTKIFDVETFLKFILENCDQESLLDAASSLYVTFLIGQFEDKQQLLSLYHIPDKVLDVFNVLLRRNQIECIIKLAKFCQILWSESRKELNLKNASGVGFIIVQLIPVYLCNKKPPETKLFDVFVQKLFNWTSNNTQKFGYAFRDLIRSRSNSKLGLNDWAVKGVLSVTENMNTLNHEEAVLIFQSLAYALKPFLPLDICGNQNISSNINEKDNMPLLADASLLSAVVNALCILIEKFKINWSESLESLCLLKVTCYLLQNSNLPSTLVVQMLLLVNLAILNFMSPNLALLTNKTEDSSFDCLMPLLYKRMHDPNWEVRDSCIEVITTITELAESKYPAFQQLLMEKDFCCLIFDIMEGDSESYVRASALRALSAMTKIEYLKQNLKRMDFSSKVIKILQTESEGIVRREAALLVKQLYLCQKEETELLNSFYQVMGYTALCDLHWEVKVNSLVFWEAVIQDIIADQGMIDGSFPKVTFSKEHKKIVTLTNEEIKLRLDKVLKELSKVGCLYVLLSTLNDDCDFQVVQKSAHILSDLISILRRYNVIKPCENYVTFSDRMSMKRKNTDLNNFEKRKPPTSIVETDDLNEIVEKGMSEPPSKSDAIIEEIVNEMDINLLVSVCYPEEDTTAVEKKILLHEIKPEAFLLQIQGFDSEKFLHEKQKWFMNIGIDLKDLVNDMISVNSFCETNIMDCY